MVVPGLRELPVRTDISAQHSEVLFEVVLLLFFYTEF